MSKKTSIQKTQIATPAQVDEFKKALIKRASQFREPYQTEFIDKVNKVTIGGMYFWSSSNDIVVVEDIKKNKYGIRVLYRKWDYGEKAWDKQKDYDIKDFIEYAKMPPLTKHPLELFIEAEQALDSGDISKYQIDNGDQLKEEPDTQLLHIGSKETLQVLSDELQKKRDHADIIQTAMYEIIEQRKAQLEKVTEKLTGIIKLFEKKILKIRRVITTIEVYLGIEEEVLQILEGPFADESEPVCIRQGIMYMDEEVGDPWDDGQGIEWKDISDFDKWVTRNSNYKKVIPEQKGIVALQARREHKDRGNMNPYLKHQLEQQDKFTFLLMRNGDNLFRLITDKIEFNPRLFPRRKELQDLFELWHAMDALEQKNDGESTHIWSGDNIKNKFKDKDVEFGSDTGETKELTEDSVFFYKMRFALFQGLFERTQIFHPTKEPIRLFAEHGNGAVEKGLVRLIYDDELTLPGGRLAFWDWMTELNKSITFGSRVVLADGYALQKCDTKSRLDDRFTSRHDYRLPPDPKPGLYYTKAGERYDNEPVWIPNPDHNPNEYTTKNEHRWHAEDVDKGDTVEDHMTTKATMSYTEQKKWFGKIVNKDTFDHHRTEDHNGNPLTDDDKHGDVRVKRNPLYLHKCTIHVDNVNSEKWKNGKLISSTIEPTKRFKFLFHDVKKKFLSIRYNPKDTVGEWDLFGNHDPHERKHSLTFKINPKDQFIVNFDSVTIEDIDFYLNSRVDRRHYIYMMPVLWKVREMLVKEKEEEKDFILLVKAEVNKATGVMPDDSAVDKAIHDWKTNLKWKRAIHHNDQKALRMIVKKLSKLDQ